MLKNLLTGCALLATIVLYSCGHKRPPNKTIITGKIVNMGVQPGIKEFTLTVVGFGGNPETYTVPLQANGSFKISFDQYIAQDVSLKPIVNTLIAHPGDSIHVDIDFKDIGNVKFSGDAARTNADLYHYINEYYVNSELENLVLASILTQLNQNKFQEKCELERTKLLFARDEFIQKHKPNDELTVWTSNYINARYYTAVAHNIVLHNLRKAVYPPLEDIKRLQGFNSDMAQLYNTTLFCTKAYALLPWLSPWLDKGTAAAKNKNQQVALLITKIKHDVKNDRLHSC